MGSDSESRQDKIEQNFEYRDIRNRFRFIPFGKFSASGRGSPPFNQVMVGRLKSRANFIRKLIEHDRFGAVLVSGRRGSGKTSFVTYVLHAYRRETYKRFQRNTTDRGMPLVSRSLGIIFAIVVSIILTLYVQGIELAAFNQVRKVGAETYLLIIVICALMALPMLLIWNTWRTWRALYLLLKLSDRDSAEWEKGRPERRWWHPANLITRSEFWLVGVTVFALVLVWFGFAEWLADWLKTAGDKPAKLPFRLWDVLAVVLSLLAATAITTGAHEVWYAESASRKSATEQTEGPQRKPLLIVWTAILTLIFSIGYFFLWDGLSTLSVSSRSSWIFLISLTGITALAAVMGNAAMPERQIDPKGRLRPRGLPTGLLLACQMTFTIAAALALIAPVLFVAENILTSSSSVTYDTRPLRGILSSLIKWVRIDNLATCIITAFLILLVSLQQSWIGRGLARERQDSSMHLLGRAPGAVRARGFWNSDPNCDEEHALDATPLDESEKGWSQHFRLRRRNYVARQIEKTTLAHMYYAIRAPVIVLWINLGFDDLRHARIIEAMLSELRLKYKARFSSLRSPTFQLNLVLLIIATLAVTRVAASSFFDYGLGQREMGGSVSAETESASDDQSSAADETPVQTGGNPGAGAAGQIDGEIVIRAAGGMEVAAEFGARESGPGPDLSRVNYARDVPEMTPDYCTYFANNPAKAPPVTSLVCMLPWSNSILQGLYVRVLPLEYPAELVAETSASKMEAPLTDKQKAQTKTREIARITFDHLKEHSFISFLMDRSADLPAVGEPKNGIDGAETISLRMYHMLLFLICGLLLIRTNRMIQLAPYGQRVREMDALIDRLQGRVTNRMSDGPDGGFLQKFLGLRRLDRTIEAEPDPRIVEQSFLDLLRRVGTKRNRWRGPLDIFESPPEIVFVFDEMDKLSGRVDVENSRTDEAGTAVEENARDRARSLQLHKLLSDMKRLLGSNAARFIFIGNRLYHDEWLADQANRSPLLSSIFTEELYLTSLLTDRDHPYGHLNDRIAEYLVLMYQNAVSRYRTPDARLEEPEFIQAPLPDTASPRRVVRMANRVGMSVLDDTGKKYGVAPSKEDPPPKGDSLPETEELASGGRETIEQLLNFLTYRSGGNPRRFQELMGELMQPKAIGASLAGRSYARQRKLAFGRNRPTEPPGESIDAEDCLVLDDRTLYRIQFVDVLYRHVCDHMEGRIMDRDDKVAMSVFYLMDFLLKFHNRGFLLTNLQRVDELSHIHRAPDLRSLMGTLVNISSERFLHRVLNGVYTHRFRSDFAREIDYLSRISTSEMAAFNFTLDESQSLKGLYQQTLKTGDNENVDTVSGLGELYEYDQDHEIARNYYRRAIALLDERFHKETGREFRSAGYRGDSWRLAFGGIDADKQDGGDGVWSAVGFILHAGETEDAKALIRANLPWAMARVRLMLQIGHTYEQENNYERALASYMHAGRLSDVVLAATGRAQDDTDANSAESPHPLKPRTLNVDGASLLYQARLASAWVFEKDNQDIDESTYQMEEALFQLYQRNPILFECNLKDALEKQLPMKRNRDFYSNETNNISLTASDLHNKSGDLYFYKGRTRPRHMKPEELTIGRLGYLRRAQRHYANSLHHVRLYIYSRSKLSGLRLGPNREKKNIKDTIPGKSVQPDMVQNTLGNTLTDLAETILAQSSISGIVSCFPSCKPIPPEKLDELDIAGEVRKVRDTLIGASRSFHNDLAGPKSKDDASKLVDDLTVCGVKWCAGPRVYWVGEWNSKVTSPDRLRQFNSIIFGEQDKADRDRGECSDFERLVAYISLSTCAAEAYSDAGYPTDAANEYLLQAQSMISIIWGTRYLDKVNALGAKEANKSVKERAEAWCNIRRADHQPTGADVHGLRAGLGIFAMNSLQMALRELELAYRPSTTGAAQNIGNPASAKWSPESQAKLQDAYDETQIWRDDPRVKTLAAGLVLSLSDTSGAGDQDTFALEHKIAAHAYDNLLRKYARQLFPDRGGEETWTSEHARATFQGLYRINERHRYPILNRLNTFKQQLDAALIVGDDLFAPHVSPSAESGADNAEDRKNSAMKERKGFVGRITKELLATANLYGSELHFSPHKIGSALALAGMEFSDSEPRAYFDPLGETQFERQGRNDENWAYFERLIKEKDTEEGKEEYDAADFPDLPNVSFTQESMEVSAMNHLRRAEELCGLGRAYYENISPLSYLNDDFNDRKMHYNHAQRMLMTDITDLLLAALSEQRSVKSE